jgi:NAD(P)-dependent dehydrogenase (short-subunit alcohol dehydrogenase family)
MTTSPTSVLISGANRGLGLQTATELADRGWVVWLASRDLEAGKAAAGRLAGDVRSLQLDVTSDESVAAAVETVEAAGTGLDVLVNGAGIVAGDTGDPATVAPTDFLATFGVNLLGPIRLTRAFLPLLRQSSDPRIVMVSSGMGSITRTSSPDTLEHTIPSLVYSSSKAALNMVTTQYAKMLPDFRINAVDPGYTATDLNGHRGHKTVAEGARIIVDTATAEPGGPTGGFYDEDGVVPW